MQSLRKKTRRKRKRRHRHNLLQQLNLIQKQLQLRVENLTLRVHNSLLPKLKFLKTRKMRAKSRRVRQNLSESSMSMLTFSFSVLKTLKMPSLALMLSWLMKMLDLTFKTTILPWLCQSDSITVSMKRPNLSLMLSLEELQTVLLTNKTLFQSLQMSKLSWDKMHILELLQDITKFLLISDRLQKILNVSLTQTMCTSVTRLIRHLHRLKETYWSSADSLIWKNPMSRKLMLPMLTLMNTNHSWASTTTWRCSQTYQGR